MKTAREVAHQAFRAAHERGAYSQLPNCVFLAGDTDTITCEEFQAALEQDRREMVEACAEVADGWCDHSDACTKAIRSLSPKGTT